MNTESSRLVDGLATLRGAAGVLLGVFELVAPHRVTKADGLKGRACGLVRAAGAHKVGAGLGLLTMASKTPVLQVALVGSLFDGMSLVRHRARPAAYARLAAVVAIDAALLWMFTSRPGASANATGRHRDEGHVASRELALG
jgi:hypothetical protein